MPLHCIYMHTFPNGKTYIGQTVSGDCESRWRNGEGYKGQKVYTAIKEFGWGNIKHEILEDFLTDDEVDSREIDCISRYDSIKNGYNVALGGKTNRKNKESTLLMHIVKLAGYKNLNDAINNVFDDEFVAIDSDYDSFNFLAILVDSKIVKASGYSSIGNYRSDGPIGILIGQFIIKTMCLLECLAEDFESGLINRADLNNKVADLFERSKEIMAIVRS